MGHPIVLAINNIVNCELYGKFKVIFTLEQAIKTQRASRNIAILLTFV